MAYSDLSVNYGYLDSKAGGKDARIAELEAQLASQAEVLADKRQDARMWSERARDAESTSDALADERQELRRQLMVARAEAAAIRGVLQSIIDCKAYSMDEIEACLSGMAGQELLEELARLQIVVKAARSLTGSEGATFPNDTWRELLVALAALDAGWKGETLTRV